MYNKREEIWYQLNFKIYVYYIHYERLTNLCLFYLYSVGMGGSKIISTDPTKMRRQHHVTLKLVFELFQLKMLGMLLFIDSYFQFRMDRYSHLTAKITTLNGFCGKQKNKNKMTDASLVFRTKNIVESDYD